MNLIISGIGMIVCTVALVYMIVKKPNSKQKNAGTSKYVLQLIPERDYDDELEAFIIDKDMTGYQYMDLIEIKSQDLQNLSDDEVYFNMAKFSRCFKRYDADIKIIALNFPCDMSKQKAFYSKKRENTKNARYKRWIDRKLEQFEWLELNQTTRQYYFKIFAENEEKIVLLRNRIMDDLGLGRDGLLLEIDKEKKNEILNKCNNKNSMIRKRENNE